MQQREFDASPGQQSEQAILSPDGHPEFAFTVPLSQMTIC
jgi:hypothetical protein